MRACNYKKMCKRTPYTHPLPRGPHHHPKVASASLVECTTLIWASDSVAATVCRGVVYAVCKLLQSSPPTPNWIPQLIDERQWPLCDTHSPLTSFLWTTPHVHPDVRAVGTYVCLLATRLRMTVSELAVSLSLLELVALSHAGIVQPYTLRPLLYATSVVARKHSCDYGLRTRDCYDAIEDLFTNACPRAVARIETQLLVLIDWRVPLDADMHEVYVTDLYDAGLQLGQKDCRNAVLSNTDTLNCCARANRACASSPGDERASAS
jgi:hypothetical protein